MEADLPVAIQEARAKLRQQFGNVANARVAGVVRRKKAVTPKAPAVDNKKVEWSLKRMGLSSIPGIEEVTMITDNDEVMSFATPKVLAAPGANTYVVSGHKESKKLDPSQLYQNPFSEEFMQQLLAAAGRDDETKLQKLCEAKKRMETTAAQNEEVPRLEKDFDEIAELD